MPTKGFSLVDKTCYICYGKSYVNQDDAEAHNISTKPKNEYKVDDDETCT